MAALVKYDNTIDVPAPEVPEELASLIEMMAAKDPDARLQTCDAVVAAFQASAAGVVCLCGTDRAYAAQAVALTGALKEAGASMVLLAGPPNDDYAGVDMFLYRGCDALEVLRTTWSRLEAAR